MADGLHATFRMWPIPAAHYAQRTGRRQPLADRPETPTAQRDYQR